MILQLIHNMKLEDLFAQISSKNLQRAEELRVNIDDRYWEDEIDSFYRYFHGSFKMFRAQGSACDYLECMFALVGEETEDYKQTFDKLQKLDLDARFVCLMRNSLKKVQFHQGEMKHWEWRDMAAACYSARLAADASIRYVRDILEGKLYEDEPLDYYEALFIYLWKVDDIRHGKRNDVLEKARKFGSEDVKKAYKNPEKVI
jgi:hypothetical protein